MSLFTRIVAMQVNKGFMNEEEGDALLLHLDEERSAYLQGNALPVLPREWKKRWAFSMTWALHRLHLERPAVFTWGLLCAMPAALVTLYWVGVRLWNLATRMLGVQ